MKTIIITGLWTALAIYGFSLGCWVLYVAAMNFKRVYDAGQAGRFARFNGRIVWFIAQPIDLLLNILWSILLLDFPRELLLSPKLKRLKKEGGWRGRIATFVCRELLNPFDPDGKHC